MGIEILESRIAPAAVFHYTDENGDRVSVKTSKGTSADLASICGVKNGHLNVIDFSQSSGIAAEFAGTDITITDGGHNRVDIGVIVAHGSDASLNLALGNVSIAGSLGSISAGTGSGKAIGTLSMKALNGDPTAYASHIYGSIDIAKIAGALTGKLTVDDNIGTLRIGKLLGQSLTESGYVGADNITTLKVKNGIFGGNGTNSGFVSVSGEITTTTVGKILGGGGSGSARLQASTFGSITVNGDIKGGSGTASAEIYAPSGSFQTLLVKGGVLGGQGAQSGRVVQTGSAQADGSVVIKGNLQAGAGTGSASVNLQGALGSLWIKGSMDAAGQSGSNYAGAVLAKTLAGSSVKVGGLHNNAIIWIGGVNYYHVSDIPG
jgi:hypothetical protein